jgi:membrane associated rhomboid family serine protease
MRVCVPVTLGAVVGGVLGTALLASRPEWWAWWTTWAVHADARHLVCDLAALGAYGSWIERRAGSVRMLAWVLAGVLVSQMLHVMAYPGQGALLGLSAVGWTVASAGTMALARGWAWMALVVIAGLLAHECLGSGHGVMVIAGEGLAGTLRFVEGVRMEPVPVVHAGCAAIGGVLGVMARRRAREELEGIAEDGAGVADDGERAAVLARTGV